MKKFLEKKLVRVRCKKNYAEAHCHVIIGEVLDENEAYVVIKGRRSISINWMRIPGASISWWERSA